MLTSLHIRNYALIDRLDIDFPAGFSVITGETGSGKSIMLGALALLVGGRADVKTIRTGATKCIVEAEFQVKGYGLQTLFEENEIDYADECVLRREVLATGKSRAFVNDTPAPLSLMREVGSRLVDIHSQHQNLLLHNAGFQIEVLDTLAGDSALLNGYRELYRAYTDACQRLKRLKDEAARAAGEEEYLRFQVDRLNEAQLSAGEQEELEQEAETLTHAEEIKGKLYQAHQVIDSEGEERNLLAALKECANGLRSIARYYPAAAELEERLHSSYIELNDIAGELGHAEDRVEFNPDRLQAVNDRLSLIYDLQQKHRVSSVEELIALRDSLAAKLEAIDSSEEKIAELQTLCRKLSAEVRESAARLTEARTQAARTMEQEMTDRLTSLRMPHARFLVDIKPTAEPTSNGADAVCFLFSANKNGVPQPVANVASGGEIARVMLALKAMIAQAIQLPTILFDEIDTGVSGETAERMAHIMREMSSGDRQVISITHLPQIAACGAAHYKVYKEDTETETNSSIRLLSHAERVEELAHMLSGATLSEAALNNARVLLGETADNK